MRPTEIYIPEQKEPEFETIFTDSFLSELNSDEEKKLPDENKYSKTIYNCKKQMEE